MKEKVKEAMEAIKKNPYASVILAKATVMAKGSWSHAKAAHAWAMKELGPLFKDVLAPILAVALALLIAHGLGWLVVKTTAFLIAVGTTAGVVLTAYMIWCLLGLVFEKKTTQAPAPAS